jgi:hypothetical protein
MQAFPGNELCYPDVVLKRVKHNRSIECGHSQVIMCMPPLSMNDVLAKPILGHCQVIRLQPTWSLRGAYAQLTRMIGEQLASHRRFGIMKGKPRFQNLVCAVCGCMQPNATKFMPCGLLSAILPEWSTKYEPMQADADQSKSIQVNMNHCKSIIL